MCVFVCIVCVFVCVHVVCVWCVCLCACGVCGVYVCVLTGKAAASKLPTTSGNGSVAMVADSPAEDTGTNMKITGKEGGGGGFN